MTALLNGTLCSCKEEFALLNRVRGDCIKILQVAFFEQPGLDVVKFKLSASITLQTLGSQCWGYQPLHHADQFMKSGGLGANALIEAVLALAPVQRR